MLPERTTTIGDGESVITERPFHIYSVVSDTKRQASDGGRNAP